MRTVTSLIKAIVHRESEPVDKAVKFLEKEMDAGCRTNEDITEIVSELSNKDRSIFWVVFNMLNKKRSERWFASSLANKKLILKGLINTAKSIHPFLQVVLNMAYDLRKKEK